MKNVKLLIVPLITAMLLTAVAPTSLLAAPKDDVCEGVNFTSGTPGSDCGGATADASVRNIVATVIDILSVIVGIVAVIMIIIGGLKYITSSGDSNNVSSAKNTILYAVIGLVVVLLAQIIVRFVIDTATQVPTP